MLRVPCYLCKEHTTLLRVVTKWICWFCGAWNMIDPVILHQYLVEAGGADD